MSRSIVLEKLRRLARPHLAPELPARLPDFPVYQDPVAQFQRELETVSGVFLDARSPELLTRALERVLADNAASEIYWDTEDLFHRHGIPYLLRDPEAFRRHRLVFSSHPLRQVSFPLLLDSRPYSRQILAGLTLSALSAACGIAETGTVMEKLQPGTGRLLPVLSPAHLAFLREQDLVMNHAGLFSTLRLGETESYQVLVTGPSRTADIEKTLVLGVHGPQRHYVVLTA